MSEVQGQRWQWRQVRTKCRECTDFPAFLRVACSYHSQWLQVDQSSSEELRLLSHVAGCRITPAPMSCHLHAAVRTLTALRDL